MPQSVSEPIEAAAAIRAMPASERIYTDYFGLRMAPFSITPDPEFLFLSDTHQSVIEKIHYGIHSRMGFMLLAGEVGTGKTTLCRELLDRLQERARTVYLINPSLNSCELLAGILEDLGIGLAPGASKKELIDHLNRYLLADPGAAPLVIIIDDAQTMPLATLEDLRLLSNLETDKSKLLQLLLVGQPELLAQLNRPELRQLQQRVTLHCRLAFLTLDEVAAYIQRRLFVAGNQGQVRFAAKAVRKIHRLSGGVPRLINKICDLALTAAYAANAHQVETAHVRAASQELIETDLGHCVILPRVAGWRNLMRRMAVAAAALALMGGIGGFWTYRDGVPEAVELRPAHAQASFGDIPAPAVDLAQATAPLPPEAGPYILQLGSYATLGSTQRAIDFYRQKGIAAYWSPIDRSGKGRVYRLFSGRYASASQARQYQQAHGLNEAKVMLAPWTVVVGPATSAKAWSTRISPDGFDPYPACRAADCQVIYAGAFESQAGAQTMASQIEQQSGLTVDVTECAPAQKDG